MKQTGFILLAVFFPAALLFPAESPDDSERRAWSAVGGELAAKGRGAFPDMARLMDGTPPGSRYLELAFMLAAERDGWDILSQGSPELLAATRGAFLRADGQGGHPDRRGLLYLAQKGDAGDLPRFERLSPDGEDLRTNTAWASALHGLLRHRAAGTNIVGGSPPAARLYPRGVIDGRDLYSTNDLRFLPSVANTGPQAEYVYKAYRQAIGLRGGVSGRDTPYSIITNVAPELLAMRVWFDAGGNPVTGTDLSRRGISVPGLGFAGADTPAPPAAGPPAGPPPRPRSAVPLAVGAGVLSALLLFLRSRKKARRM